MRKGVAAHHIELNKTIMKSAFDRKFKIGVYLSFIDLMTFNVIYLLNTYFDFYFLPGHGFKGLMGFVLSNVSYLIALSLVNISLHHRFSQPAKVLSNTSRTSLFFIVLYTSILGMSGLCVPDWGASLLMVFTLFLATTIERLVLRRFIKAKRYKGHNLVNTVIVGSGDMMQRAVNIMADPFNGYKILGYFSDEAENPLYGRDSVMFDRLGSLDDVLGYIQEHHVREIYLSARLIRTPLMKQIMLCCEKNMIRLYFVPDTLSREFKHVQIKEFGDMYVLSQYNEPLYDIRQRMKKRIFDICVSLIFLCMLFPFILLIVSIISKITMPGPLFFRQKRTGYDGKDFYCIKFRSMKVNKDADKAQAVKNDPRVTRWGAFMRHCNIDELPQFINVLKGDMSIVGPRPHMLAHTNYYSEYISDYMIRHFVKPGITGWAQTNGERGETKTVEDMKRRVDKDIWYIEHWSMWLDVQIMFKTVTDMLHGDKKAY